MDAVRLTSQGLPEQTAPGKPPGRHLLILGPHRVGRRGSAAGGPLRTELLDRKRAVWSGRLHLVSAAGLSAFVIAVLALHGIQANLNPAEHTISEYSLSGTSGWLMRAAFVGLGVGTLATAASLGLSCQPSGVWRRLGLLVLAGAAIGAFLDAGFNTDHLRVPETPDGMVHSVGTAILVLGLPGAAFILGSDLLRHATSTSDARVLLTLGAAQLGAIVLFEMSPVTLRGWAERLVAVLAVATLGLLQVLSRAIEPAGLPRSVVQRPPSWDRSSVFGRLAK